jgi:outer membrane biogenesis lipoprotein LolB
MKIIKITIFLLMAAFLILNTACSEQEKEAKTTMEDVKKETREMVETAKSYTMEQRHAYQQELADKFAEYDRKIETFKQQMNMVKGETERKMQENIDMLQSKVDDMKKRAEKLKNAGGDAWTDLRNGLEKAEDDLDRSFSEAMKNF